MIQLLENIEHQIRDRSLLSSDNYWDLKLFFVYYNSSKVSFRLVLTFLYMLWKWIFHCQLNFVDFSRKK